MKLNVCLLAATVLLTTMSPFSRGAEPLDKPASASASPSTPAPPGLTPGRTAETVRFNLDITGGHFESKPGVRKEADIGKLVEFLRAEVPNLNIVLSPGTADIKVTDLRLRSVDVVQFLEALVVATGNNVQWKALSGPAVSEPIYSVFSRPISEQRVEVFNLSQYLAQEVPFRVSDDPGQHSEKVESVLADIIRIIDETVQSASIRPADRIIHTRFHRGAKLLVVQGAPNALEVARKVVTALNEPFQRQQNVREDLR